MSYNPDTIHKALRVLPEFDGNPHVLTRFIRLCDQLVIAYIKDEPGYELCNISLLSGILNKITGPAARFINSNGIAENWQGIRSALINNFADQRDETALYNDIAIQVQGNSTPMEYYERCQTLFSTIMTYVTLHESVQTTIEAKRDLYKKLTMQAFLRGLKEPLGSRIRCMRPETIEKALEYVQEEQNTLYLQQRNDSLPKALSNSSVPHIPTIQTNWQKPFANIPQPQQFKMNMPQPHRMPMPIYNNYNNRPQFNRMPNRTQQMFRAVPPNYNPNSNLFRLPPRNPNLNRASNGSTPMSGVNRFDTKPLPPSGHDWRRFGNPPPTNYMKAREVNFNEFDYDYDYDQNYYYYESDNYSQDHTYDKYPDNYNYNNYELYPCSSCSNPALEENEKKSEGSNDENFRLATEPKKANIEINFQIQRQLCFIQISEPPLKLLLDTGANQSFISPEVVENYFSNIPLNYDPFEVTNVHATTKSDYSITLPCFEELGDSDDITLFVYKFHNYFDGLIGLDLLNKWEAKIDLKDKFLVTKFAINPIVMYDSKNVNLYEDIIPANSSKLVRVPINSKDGDVLVPKQKISNCIIPTCLTSVKKNRGIIEVLNPTQNDAIFSMDRSINTEINNIESFDKITLPVRTREVLSRLRTNHLNPEERTNLEILCAKYADIFYIEGETLTFTNKIKHCIRTTDEIPIYTKSYRYPHVHREEVRDQIERMLSQGIIKPSDSAWSSPIWVVPKKADASGKQKWRLVVDFRKLNEKTINDKYPIPNIADVLDKLGKCQYFTTLDLASGFYQVEMDPNDTPKTAFNVENGHFEFLRMPMGLKNSPSTFQRVMDNVLRGLQNVICLVYLDDIIVFSTSLQEHIVNLEKVFQRLRESNFKIQMDKSEFLKLETAYLGHIISKDGIKPNPDKISAIEKYPIPKTPKQIKQFLGLLGYYRKFIPDFARITKPFTQCLKKGIKIVLNSEYINCFEKCKLLLSNDPILQYPDFEKEFILTTDASNVALGAILSQGPIGSDKPISYASRTLNSSELNYSTIEKELLAIVWATKYFRPYLFGRKFKILTDHKPLQWVMNLKEPNSRLTRWRLKLSEFDFTVIYKKGKSNTNADALSRVEIYNEESDSMIVNPTERSRSPAHSSSTETALTPNSSTETAHTSHENPILEIPIVDDPLNKYQKQLHIDIVSEVKRQPKISKPFETHTRVSAQVSENNLEEDLVSVIKEFVRPNIKTAIFVTPPLGMYSIVPILQSKFRSSSMNLVLVKSEMDNVNDYLRQQEIIKHYHDGKTNHRGINESYLALSRRYYWPKMKDHITKFINECSICGQAKYDRHPIHQQLNIVPPPTRPFEVLHMDLFTAEHEKYVTFIDVFSKYGQAYHLRDGTAISVIQALLNYSTHHRLPFRIITDQGTEFTNQLFVEFCRLHKIAHHKTSAHAPNENGNIERFHSTILEHLRILRLQKRDESVTNLMPYALLAYNSSIHSFTKCRPYDLIIGHTEPRDPLDFNLSEQLFQLYIQNHKEQMKKVYNIVNEASLADRTQIIDHRNRDREPVVDLAPQQQIFINNPQASRQKLAPRFTQDTVVTNLPIHIYTSRKRQPIAKSRLKRVPKSANLLQDTAAARNDNPTSGESRDKT